MKFLLSVVTGLILLSSAGCSQERRYIYPQGQRLELQRICRSVTAGNSNRFMVLLGKIYPLNNDGPTAPLEEISTTLEDAGYFCGPYRLKNSACPTGKNRRLDKSACAYSR
jgi:hypothetical protein